MRIHNQAGEEHNIRSAIRMLHDSCPRNMSCLTKRGNMRQAGAVFPRGRAMRRNAKRLWAPAAQVVSAIVGVALVALLIGRGSTDDLTEAHRIVDHWQDRRPGIRALDLCG